MARSGPTEGTTPERGVFFLKYRDDGLLVTYEHDGAESVVLQVPLAEDAITIGPDFARAHFTFEGVTCCDYRAILEVSDGAHDLHDLHVDVGPHFGCYGDGEPQVANVNHMYSRSCDDFGAGVDYIVVDTGATLEVRARDVADGVPGPWRVVYEHPIPDGTSLIFGF